jgi:hypothetical protein
VDLYTYKLQIRRTLSVVLGLVARTAAARAVSNSARAVRVY